MNERTCILTKETLPKAQLLRFVAGMDGKIVPDISFKLPGRGVYLKAQKNILKTAIEQKILVHHLRHKLSKSKYKQDLAIKDKLFQDDDLFNICQDLLKQQALKDLSIARKAGFLLFGFDNCMNAIKYDKIAILFNCSDAKSDGKNKLSKAITKNFHITNHQILELELFNSQELRQIFGELNIMHFAILNNINAKKLLNKLEKLQNFLK